MVYLDNSATTRPSQAVRDAMVHSMEEVYFNPSALYGPAMQAEKELTAARKALADQLGVPAKNVTSQAPCASSPTRRGLVYTFLLAYATI